MENMKYRADGGCYGFRGPGCLLLHYGLACLICLIQRARGFRRHVIFIVLREHLVCAENAILRQLSLSDHAFALLEKIGKDACIYNRDNLCGIRHHEIHRHTVALTLDAALFHQPADAKALAHRGFVIRYLGRAEEENQITLESVQNEYRSNAQRGYARSDDCQFFMTWFHFPSLV